MSDDDTQGLIAFVCITLMVAFLVWLVARNI